MYAEGKSDVGKVRQENQDFVFSSAERIGPFPNLFIVADGMGGHNAGDVASKTAVEYICGYIKEYPHANFIQPNNYLDMLVSAAQRANEAVFNMSCEDEQFFGMGTTLTACVIEAGKAIVAHVGDSRLYGIKPGEIKQLTKDHTYVEEMVLLGELTAEHAKIHPKRHVLTRVLGTQKRLNADGIIADVGGYTALLLCSDGLTNMLDDSKILEIVNNPGFVEHRVENLINEANQQGGKDNISAILIDIGR